MHTNGYLDWRLNTTFITLIPNKEGEKTVHDFCPISLLAGIYKIIGKILASRLKTVMSALISDHQCGSLEGREIHDGVLIVNELLDSRLKSKVSGLMYKIDFQKAFDSVSWTFLDRLLSSFGFGEKWRHWLRVCWKMAKINTC